MMSIKKGKKLTLPQSLISFITHAMRKFGHETVLVTVNPAPSDGGIWAFTSELSRRLGKRKS